MISTKTDDRGETLAFLKNIKNQVAIIVDTRRRYLPTRKNNSAHSPGNLSPSFFSEELSLPVCLSIAPADVASAFLPFLFFQNTAPLRT